MYSNILGWAKIIDGRVVRLSSATRRPRGAAWGAVTSMATQVGDAARLDGRDVYLVGGV